MEKEQKYLALAVGGLVALIIVFSQAFHFAGQRRALATAAARLDSWSAAPAGHRPNARMPSNEVLRTMR
jgi:hypothetical protein